LSYNGGLPGPTLHLQPGDRVRVQLVNRLNDPTNLHVHGLHVSPEGNGDNAFVTVKPGASFDYDYQLPPDHPPGVYWYHPHHHGTVADQIFGGLYGAIIVSDPVRGSGQLPVTRERVVVISDITLNAAGSIRFPSAMARMRGREGDLVLVNGQARPILSAQAGALAHRQRLHRSLPAAAPSRPKTGAPRPRLRPLRRSPRRHGSGAGKRQPGRPACHHSPRYQPAASDAVRPWRPDGHG
jgi:FtsP/CotA-like multicopper oxidase with cupredoxin domain